MRPVCIYFVFEKKLRNIVKFFFCLYCEVRSCQFQRGRTLNLIWCNMECLAAGDALHSGVHSDLPVRTSNMNSLDTLCVPGYVILLAKSMWIKPSLFCISIRTLCVGGGCRRLATKAIHGLLEGY